MIILSIFFAYSIAALIVTHILQITSFNDDFIGYFLGGLCIILYLYILFWYLFGPKIRYKALAKLKNAENEYVFCDDVFRVFTKTEVYDGKAEVEYSLFVKVYETSKYIFMYQTNNQVFPIDKSTIEGGTVEDIRAKLMPYLGKKYIICKY